jgi:hypothetical protein
MADNWFEDVEAALNDSDEGAPEMEVTAPESESPTTEQPTELVVAEDSTQPILDTATPIVAAPEVPPVPATEPQPQNWDDPNNPYKTRWQTLNTLAERLQEQQAEKLRQEEMLALADDDPSRVREITSFVEKVEQPWKQQVAHVSGELESVAKLATVYDTAVRMVVPPELLPQVHAEVDRLMAVPGGPEVLSQTIEIRNAERGRYAGELERLRAENADLKLRTEARGVIDQRAANGADIVDSGTGTTGSFADKWDAASNFDEAFDALMETIPA